MSEIPCNADDAPCDCLDSPVLDLIGRKYAMEVVCVIANHGPVRFGPIEAHLPDASTSTLSTRLDELEAEGLIDRERYDEIPPRVEYELTDEGAELGARLKPLFEWIVAREEDVPPESDRTSGKAGGNHPDRAGEGEGEGDRSGSGVNPARRR